MFICYCSPAFRHAGTKAEQRTTVDAALCHPPFAALLLLEVHVYLCSPLFFDSMIEIASVIKSSNVFFSTINGDFNRCR
jgi:hypothetical protein